jgi:hypothetical protein
MENMEDLNYNVIRVRKREYRRPLFYSWRFVAVAVASMNGIRSLRFCFWESYLQKLVASSLQALCISCKCPDSSLQVLCKFLAKFLAKSLQEFSAGGGKSGKVGPKMASTSIQNGANLAQGVGKGYPKINRNMKKQKNPQTQTQK